MYRVVSKDGTEHCFHTTRYYVDDWYQFPDGEWCIVTSAESGEVQGEYGIDRGWYYKLRRATAEELAEQERAEAEWDALTPEERASHQIDALATRFPSLDWGD